jgi:hypothetical protein
MSKGNTTENDYVKFEANAVAMPSYGANLQVRLYTADPGEAGSPGTNEATYDDYALVLVTRDAAGWTICDGTNPYAANAAGPAYKNAAQITFPECDVAFVGTQTITHVATCAPSTSQILRKTALTTPIIVSALSTPLFPAGSLVFAED